MSSITEKLEAIAERIRFNLELKDRAREKALSLSREVIRLSTNAIRALHRQEYDKSQELLNKASLLLGELKQTLKEFEDLGYSGYAFNAEKEFAEGLIVLHLIQDNTLPSPEDLGISYPSYLNGLGEAAGELRRYILDSIRRDDFSWGEKLLAVMDDIYGILVTMDFPEALTGGLRRTTDVVRGVLEKTRGDLTMAVKQRGLGRKLEILEQKITQGQHQGKEG